MALWGWQAPEKKFWVQKPMLRVCYGLAPMLVASIYFFGWRSLVLLAVVLVAGIVSEAAFTFRQGKPITSAVLVTCLIFHLSLPPTTPFWMAVIGIVAGVALGKMIFGGFGQNVFNPAMVGRCFIYITFPLAMTGRWATPFTGGLGGFAHWAAQPPVDAVTAATPLASLHAGEGFSYLHLFVGDIAGSLGETSAFLIILGGAFILYKKAAPWRLFASCMAGAILTSGVLHFSGAATVPDPLAALLSGSFLFGAFFIVTEPISGAKTKPGQWFYGFMVGALVIVLRGFSNFPEGVMFSVLLMNAFVPLIDQTIQQRQKAAKAKKAAA